MNIRDNPAVKAAMQQLEDVVKAEKAAGRADVSMFSTFFVNEAGGGGMAGRVWMLLRTLPDHDRRSGALLGQKSTEGRRPGRAGALMRALILASLLLASCAAPAVRPRCDEPLPLGQRPSCDRDRNATPVKRPEKTTPAPVPRPEPERVPVYDGGARPGRPGEAPTGWDGNPRGYLG